VREDKTEKIVIKQIQRKGGDDEPKHTGSGFQGLQSGHLAQVAGVWGG
jgi:hypothetical protein